MILYFLYRSVIHFTQSCLVYGFLWCLALKINVMANLVNLPTSGKLTRIQPSGCICEGFFLGLFEVGDPP